MHTFRPSYRWAILFLLVSFSTAWPWPSLGAVILRRQQSSSGLSSPAPTDSKSASAPPASASASEGPAPSTSGAPPSSGTITAKPDASSTGSSPSSTGGSGSGSSQGTSGSGSGSGSKAASKTGSSASTTIIDPRLPAGGVSLITPAVISGSQYYRIGTNVTFAWNYTSLSVTPSAIDVLASCQANQHYYTIAANQTVSPSGNITWDTNSYQQTETAVQLLTEHYTLVIHDAAKDVSATAQAGYLGTYNQYVFGLYAPSPYADLDDFQCAVCNGALSNMDRNVLKFALGMCAVTILSFSWFVGGLGIF
ncbi:MAG: hypothetical protein M1838_005055 [Thelocarpon superellum]|nr:MAG: hypothetical protein M1838_005055 [Thelocarpon superellum]